jgi:hypothetical protein
MRNNKNSAKSQADAETVRWTTAIAIAGYDDENILPFRPKKTTPCLQAAMCYRLFYKWKTFPARMEDGKKYSWLAAEHAPGGENWGMTSDLEQLRHNFLKPKWRLLCGVGVPTGWVNRIFVVEIDTIKGGHRVDGIKALRALEKKHGKLPLTLMARSPSGSIHYYFKHPGPDLHIKSSASEIGDGIDVRGDGGMVVGWPRSSTRP